MLLISCEIFFKEDIVTKIVIVLFKMGSVYMTEILNAEGDLSTDVGLKIKQISQQTSLLKDDMKTIIDEGRINFNHLIKKNMNFKSQAHDLINDMTIFQKQINSEIKPELSLCLEELKKLSNSLQEVNLLLLFLNQLVEINSHINIANNKMQNKEFYECAKLIKDVLQLIKNDGNDLKFLDLFKTLSDEAIICYEHLLYQINELWSSCVTFDTKDKNELKLKTFSIDVNSILQISDILKALECLDYPFIEKKFINNFFTNILNEIILHKVVITEIKNEKAVLKLEILKGSGKPHFEEVFINLKKAIEFLKVNLNLNIRKDVNFLHKIGTDIGNELAEKLIKNCLAETIPTSSEDMEKYNDVVKSARDFEVQLKECGFLPESSTCLFDYAKNINVLFANRFCQSYLEKARGLMKKDLHNLTTSKEIIISNINELPKIYGDILKIKLNIQEDTFTFPKCQISKSAEEITDLVIEMVTEILKSQELCAVRLFYTIRNIFEMYSAVVPLHHRKFLDTLPHQVALFHNNCIYFTHYLVHLTCEYFKKIPTILKEDFSIFLEEAVLLRTLAKEKLEQHVTAQKNQLMYILLDSGLAVLKEDPNLNPNTEKCIRQCIRQLQILQSVWKDVLPLKVYNRTIGFLLDSVIDELISLIMAVEDISCQTATDLASMFNILIERAPALFEDPKEIFRHSKKWLKFNEFIVVLKGSLRDIDERWSNGLGPLASEFTPEQVKHLIRALFQNSERRSAILNRIK